MYRYVCTSIYVYVYIYIYIYVHMYNVYKYMNNRTYICLFKYVMFVYKHEIDTCMYTCTHIHQ